MNDVRPDPDTVLAHAVAEDATSTRGKLMIFFGYAAGVGKTYAMLKAAHRDFADGVDVVIGYVEPHGRKETESLIEGLEVLPARQIAYRGITLKELDLDAALRRRPALILVDELAHTNAEGSRHVKRWQDVEELLAAGINVYTTLNVQHVESLNDVIAQITGVAVRETLPDSVLERADKIELVDLTPEELVERLKKGKVYVPQQAARALQHFFQPGNLTALREMSLRQVAQRLSKDVDAARQAKSADVPWPTSERLLVCVGPSPTSAKLIRTAKRMASAFGAEWLAVAVDPIGTSTATTDARQRVAHHLRLAERLGAETHTLTGDDVAQTILGFATSRNVMKIVVGKTSQPRWKRYLYGTVVDSLLERSGNIDVYVIRGVPEEARPRPTTSRPTTITLRPYFESTAVVAVCALLGWLSQIFHLTEANIVMVFLLGVAIVAGRFGRGPSIAAAVISVLVFDFFFVQPKFTFAVSDAQYTLTFTVMLLIGIGISALTARIKEQLQSTRQLQRRTAALFRLTKQLTEVSGTEFLVRTAGQQLQEIFDGEVALYVSETPGPMQLRFGENANIARNDVNATVAQWVADHGQMAGMGTDTLPNATALFVPLIGSQRTIGALGVRSNDPERFFDPDQGRLLETCASLIALSLERDQSVLEASNAELRVQTEEMRNALLSSISHDLRTPLAVITAAADSLMKGLRANTNGAEKELFQTIAHESNYLTRLVENLLDITQLESGAVVPNRQWHVLEEIVGSAINRLRHELGKHHVDVAIADDLPLLLLDGILMEQVFVNLLENAARYSPAGSHIVVSAQRQTKSVIIRVADDGPGLPPGHESQVLEKFFRAPPSIADGRRGIGLGLAICKAVIRIHGGDITARNRTKGGAEFVIRLPIDREPPQVSLEEVSG